MQITKNNLNIYNIQQYKIDGRFDETEKIALNQFSEDIRSLYSEELTDDYSAELAELYKNNFQAMPLQLRDILKELKTDKKLKDQEILILKTLVNDPILNSINYTEAKTRKRVAEMRHFLKEYLLKDIQYNGSDKEPIK